MPPLALLAPAPGAGKTTIAAALLQILRDQGRSPTLSRQGDDGHAAVDSALFTRLAGSGDAEIVEVPGGDAQAEPGAPALLVADGSSPATEVTAFARSVGERLAGVVLNRVPQKRRDRLQRELEEQGIGPLLVVTEDRQLATPSLGEVASVLSAQTMFFDSNDSKPMGRLIIASISADPGQGYFAQLQATSIIVRSDKPDLQLAALNAGATTLIVTGELPLLSYVTDRAEEDEIPIIRTAMETPAAVRSIEGLYGSGAFSGSPAKLSRLAELTRGFDASSLFGA